MKNLIDELYDLHLSHHDTDNEDKEYQFTIGQAYQTEIGAAENLSRLQEITGGLSDSRR